MQNQCFFIAAASCFLKLYYHFLLRFSLLSQNFVITLKKCKNIRWAVLSSNIMINDTITKTTVKTCCAYFKNAILLT